VMTEVVERIQEVPQVLIEEQLVERQQVQTCEIIRQVQKPMVQQVQRSIPRVTTNVVEKVQQVPAVLINEVAQEVPQVQMVEVLKQTAKCSQQRIVQTSNQYERPIMREEVVQRVDTATIGGVYQAGVIGVRENVAVQPTAVERVSPIMTQGIVGGQTYETIAAPTYATRAAGAQIAAPTYMGGQVMETFAAPTYVEMAAPTTYAASTSAAPKTFAEINASKVMTQPAYETVVYQQ